ncbi:hypothetical protein M153_950004102 [Pseudoloma neurophilia]|uniref:Uncharacterized protein n=1 Tax=Pseudoloma neurophilia TaxID=146866 RepID=A0A0R0M026_9MICR|nr:hypothetical protein M153_950004102 [Pseudoloma neurophilia]
MLNSCLKRISHVLTFFDWYIVKFYFFYDNLLDFDEKALIFSKTHGFG